jgi:MYXO-CTERM domain-containing protein
MTFPRAIPAGSKVFMVSRGQFREIQGAVVSDNVVTIPVSTGGSSNDSVYPQSLTMGGDDAAVANVVGVASPDAAVPASSGGGCSATASDAGNPAGALGAATLIAAGLLVRRKGHTVRK